MQKKIVKGEKIINTLIPSKEKNEERLKKITGIMKSLNIINKINQNNFVAFYYIYTKNFLVVLAVTDKDRKSTIICLTLGVPYSIPGYDSKMSTLVLCFM